MTQPPYGGPTPPPDGPPYQPGQPYGQPSYGQPAYPPAADPYASPDSTSPSPGPGHPTEGHPTEGHPPARPGGPFAFPAAFPGSPFPGSPAQPYPPPGQPFPDAGHPYPTSGQPDQPGQPGHPPAGPPPGYPAYPAGPPARKKRGVLIGAILAVVLILCAGGGVSAWLLLRNLETGDGAAEPGAAVSGFLEAVYTEKDAAKAAELVCSEARDSDEIAKKVAEVKAYEGKYDSPRFEWEDPEVGDQNDERAIVTVKLRMTTADEKTAEQELTFTVVHKTGWWVCEVA